MRIARRRGWKLDAMNNQYRMSVKMTDVCSGQRKYKVRHATVQWRVDGWSFISRSAAGKRNSATRFVTAAANWVVSQPLSSDELRSVEIKSDEEWNDDMNAHVECSDTVGSICCWFIAAPQHIHNKSNWKTVLDRVARSCRPHFELP